MDVEEKTSIHKALVRVGKILATRRVARNLKISSVSAKLSILPEYVDAIEKGDISRLPAPPYIIGYVRSYARYLDLPAADLCQTMHNAMNSAEKRPALDFIASQAPSSSSSGRVALISVAIGIVFYVGWYMNDDTETEVTDANLPQIEAEAPAFVAENAIAEDQIVAENTISEDQNEPVSPTVTPQLDENEAELAESNVSEPVEIEESTVGNIVGNISAASAVADNRNPENEIVITAINPSWVQLDRADGSKIAAWLMQSGEVYTVATDGDVYLTTGNAGGLNIALDDGPGLIPGKRGETITSMLLDPTLSSEHNQ